MQDYDPASIQPAPESDFIFDPLTQFIEKYVGDIPSIEWRHFDEHTNAEEYAERVLSHLSDPFPPTLRVPDTIQGLPVLGIADNAFMYCGAAEIILPDTVQLIGTFAFRESAIRQLRLPRALTYISPLAVSHCRMLQQVTLAPGNRHFGLDGKFLMNRDYTEVLAYFSDDSLCGEYVVVPEGVTTIGACVFAGRFFLSLVLPRSLKKIGKFAFSHTSIYYRLVLPYGLEKIEARAFDHFKSWRSYICQLPGAVEIGDQAFAHCSIHTVLLSGNLQKISKDAFHETCYIEDGKPILKILAPKGTLGEQFARQNQLPWVDGSTTLAQLGEYTPDLQPGERYAREADFITDVDDHPSSTCVSIIDYKGKDSNLRIPPVIGKKEIAGICDSVFAQNEHIMSVHIPEGVDFIIADAFHGCRCLCSVWIPNSVTWIDDRAFSGCTSLQNFHVRPRGVTYGNHVFSQCSMLPKEIRQRSPEGVAAFFRRLFKRD